MMLAGTSGFCMIRADASHGNRRRQLGNGWRRRLVRWPLALKA